MPIVSQQSWRASTPPLPSFSNVAGSWGLDNLNPVGYADSGILANAGALDLNFLGNAPYRLNWEAYDPDTTVPPFLLDGVFDQNSQVNSLLASLTARPTLQVTTPVVVTGIGAGTYTYRGINDDGLPYWNLTGHPSSQTLFALRNDTANWTLTNGAGDGLNDSSDNTPFPWQASWTGSTVSAGTGQGEIQFNGSANGLQSDINLFGSDSQTFTGYVYFKAGSLVETSVLLETSANGTTTAKQLSVRMVAGVLTVTMGDAVPLMNTKIKTISDTNWHLLSIVIDSTAAAASQVLCWLDGSQTGWTAPLSTDLASQTGMMKQKLNVGARNNAASTFFTGSLGFDMAMFTVAHGTVLRGQWEAYLTYLYGLYSLPV